MDAIPVEKLPQGLHYDEEGNWTLDVTVDGVESQVPFDEGRRGAEKAGGADKRFRESAEAVKDANKRVAQAEEKLGGASTAVEAYGLHQKIQQGTASDDDKGRYCDIYQVSDEYRNILLHGEQPKKEPAAMPDEKPVGIKDLDRDVKARIDKIDKWDQEQEQQKCMKEIGNTIDKSDLYGTLSKEIDSEHLPEFKGKMQDLVRNELIARLEANQQYSTQLVAEAVKTVLSDVQKLESYRLKPKTPAPVTGFGGAAMSIGVSFPEGKPPERVAGSDPDYAQNAKTRLLHMLKRGR